MAGFTDLVDQAQPALFGGGVSASATEGRTWRWQFTDVLDLAGDPIDLSAVTGACKILTSAEGSEVMELTFEGAADGSFVISAAAADTVGMAPTGGSTQRKPYVWTLTLTSGAESVQAWGPTNSRFSILTED